MTTVQLRIGDVALTRAGYADIDIDPTRVGLTADAIASLEWATPVWAAGDGTLKAGAAAWVIDSGDARIVVDPAQAADEILRSDADAAAHQEAFATMLAASGVPRESVTHAVATHLEGFGMFAWREADGSWVPFFPNAPILVSQRELDAFDAGEYRATGADVIAQLRARGALHGVGDLHTLTPAVTLEHTGAHSAGHLVVRIESGNERAIVVGHLAVSPLHLGTGPCPQEHPDPDTAWAVLESYRALDGALLIGPLWPTPGAGRWAGDRFEPVDA
jgi:glyoxylase-like metal-dependent hydrolase (beta-lactamase superfamily II)